MNGPQGIGILYEDNHLLVAVKPRNMPVQQDSSGDMDMLTILKGYIKQKYDKPGDVYLGLVHRLDRPVSGALVFARTSKAAARLAQQLKSRELGREYLCVVEGVPPENGSLKNHLLKDESTNTSRAVPEGTAGAKYAELSFKRLETRGNLSLLAVELATGRSHQIRVQMSAAGYPLWGDNRYGNGKPGQMIALYAWKLRLVHPTSKQQMEFTAPMPTDFALNQFHTI